MPNYCDNYLTIDGNPDTRKKILALLKSEENCFDFEKVIPMPENIYRGAVGQKEKEIYGENNWYDWSIKNWGTKWNSVDAEIEYNVISFYTAWSPCDPVIAALAEKFPSMRFTYTFTEPGMAFCGQRVYENGEILFYFDGDYSTNYDCDCDECEYEIQDTLFPIKKSGFLTEIQSVEDVEGHVNYIKGILRYREYENNKIRMLADGKFVATKDYASRFSHSGDANTRCAA